EEPPVILGVACVFAIGAIALWQARRAAHWSLVARILGRDATVEQAKRRAIGMAIADLKTGIERGDALLCARAMDAARQIAEADSEETLVKLGFQLPERIR